MSMMNHYILFLRRGISLVEMNHVDVVVALRGVPVFCLTPEFACDGNRLTSLAQHNKT